MPSEVPTPVTCDGRNGRGASVFVLLDNAINPG